MAVKSSSTTKIAGLVLLVIGIGLAFWGYQMSESVGSQISQAISGSPTDKVMMLYIGGAASFVVGIYLFVRK